MAVIKFYNIQFAGELAIQSPEPLTYGSQVDVERADGSLCVCEVGSFFAEKQIAPLSYIYMYGFKFLFNY